MRPEELFWTLLFGCALFEDRFSRASDLLDLFESRPSCDLYDLFDVRDGGVAVEKRILDDHLCQNATHTPHVDFFIILL